MAFCRYRPVDIFLGMESPVYGIHKVRLEETSFSKLPIPSPLLTSTAWEGQGLHIFFLTFAFSIVFHFSHCGRSIMVSHCSLNLHFLVIYKIEQAFVVYCSSGCLFLQCLFMSVCLIFYCLGIRSRKWQGSDLNFNLWRTRTVFSWCSHTNPRNWNRSQNQKLMLCKWVTEWRWAGVIPSPHLSHWQHSTTH